MLYSNEMMFAYLLMYPSRVTPLLDNEYALAQIKTYENLCKLLIHSKDTVQHLYNNCVNKKTASTYSGSVSFSGLLLYTKLNVGAQFWGYSNKTGSGWANSYANVNGTRILSVGCNTGTPSSGNYASSGNSTGGYNYTFYSIENTGRVSYGGGADQGKYEASGSAFFYYI